MVRTSSTIKSVLAACLAAIVLTLSGDSEPVHAASSFGDTTVRVGVIVTSRCTILALPIVFPSTYASGQLTPLDALGTVYVDCDRGRRASVRLGQGQNADPSSTARNPLRRMRLGTTANYVSYNLYEDAAHTRVWDDDQPGVKTVRLWPVTLPVYARMDAGQTITAYGTYSDTVVATLFF